MQMFIDKTTWTLACILLLTHKEGSQRPPTCMKTLGRPTALHFSRWTRWEDSPQEKRHVHGSGRGGGGQLREGREQRTRRQSAHMSGLTSGPCAAGLFRAAGPLPGEQAAGLDA